MTAALPGNRRSILIVDDQATNIAVLVAALERDYELSFATSGERALELAASVDLILLDVIMPGLDGYEVCRRLKQRDATRHIPVIFVSALGEVDDEAAGLEIGGVDYIRKPASAAIVRARVRTHLELKEQRDRLIELAATDHLTGIANRRQFDSVLEQEWRRATRDRQPVSLLLADVDHFKLFNDHYGHAMGDRCLRLVASLLASSFGRASDLVARYGGEEFVVLIPGAGAEVARPQLERLLDRVAGAGLPHARSTVAEHVTVSVGAVSLVPPSLGSGAALARADALLYQAKDAGRGRALHLDVARGDQQTIIGRGTTRDAALRS